MQTTTLEAVLAGTWQSAHDAACLLIIREDATIFYVEQAQQPRRRLQEHLGIWEPGAAPSWLGKWLLRHRPRSLTLAVDLLSLADLTDLGGDERPASLCWWYEFGRLAGRAKWEAVYQTEYALIRHYRPCLNEQYNQGAGRTPLPPAYQEPPS